MESVLSIYRYLNLFTSRTATVVNGIIYYMYNLIIFESRCIELENNQNMTGVFEITIIPVCYSEIEDQPPLMRESHPHPLTGNCSLDISQGTVNQTGHKFF